MENKAPFPKQKYVPANYNNGSNFLTTLNFMFLAGVIGVLVLCLILCLKNKLIQDRGKKISDFVE